PCDTSSPSATNNSRTIPARSAYTCTSPDTGLRCPGTGTVVFIRAIATNSSRELNTVISETTTALSDSGWWNTASPNCVAAPSRMTSSRNKALMGVHPRPGSLEPALARHEKNTMAIAGETSTGRESGGSSPRPDSSVAGSHAPRLPGSFHQDATWCRSVPPSPDGEHLDPGR